MSGSVKRLSKSSMQAAFSGSASTKTERPTRKRLPPLSLRLSERERAELKRQAAGRPLGAFIKDRLFDADFPTGSSKLKKPSAETRKLLAQLLRELGTADIIRTVTDLRSQCEDDVLLLSPEAELALIQACVDIAAMRRDLLFALGLRSEEPS